MGEPLILKKVKFILIDNIKRHPSQLYEAFFEGIILFFLLDYFLKKKNYLLSPGKISSLFLIFYSLFRFLAEFFRSPDPNWIFNFKLNTRSVNKCYFFSYWNTLILFEK